LKPKPSARYSVQKAFLMTRNLVARSFGRATSMNTDGAREYLENHLQQPVSEEQAELLFKHLRYVIEQNTYLNLTSITDEETGFMLHVQDSLSALTEINDAPEGALVDIGTGGGFPGIPLAIMTGRPTTLVEATKKKAFVLTRFLEENGLQGTVNVLAERAEEVTLKLPGAFSVATARALSSLPSIMELAAPLLNPSGVLIAYKAQLPDDELKRAESLHTTLGMSVQKVRSFSLSDGITDRTIVILRKTGDSMVQLPRRNGLAQRHPLA
jgi:16S rRNA (guanine527-N7)-methyltransferase